MTRPVPGAPSIVPTPTAEDAAAIAVAMELLWPRPVMVVDEPDRRRPVWRFSGRWWSRPVPARRDRPWR